MSKLFVLVMFCLFFPFILIAQTGFKDGYIILSGGDTIRGQINNVNYYQNSIECRFKRDNSDSVHVFSPTQLRGYRFTNGKYYVSEQLDNGFIFLEYLVNGKLNVFFYQDKSGQNHYLISKDTIPIRELEYVKKVITIDGSMYSYESPRTIGLLNYYTYDCPALKSDIEGFKKPDHKNLIHLAEKYHKMVCSDQQCIIYEKKMPLKVKVNATFGMNFFLRDISDKSKERIFPTYGGQIVFNQLQRNENYYLGIGFLHEARIDGENYNAIPLSFIYEKSEQGISPYYAIGLDLYSSGLIEEYQAGIKFHRNRFSLMVVAGVKTEYFVLPIAISPRFYLSYDLSCF